MDNKRNYFFLIIAVIAFGIMLTGGTYAWLTFNTTTVGNNIISGDSTCFVMDFNGDFAPKGDVNFDGVVDMDDMELAYDYVDGETGESPGPDILAVVDMDDNGVIDITDVLMIYRMINNGGKTLFPSKTDKGGLMGTVTLSINEICDVNAVGYIKLNIGGTTSNQYFKNSALKYSLYASDNTTLLGSGILTTYGDKTLNTSTIPLTKTPTTYYVYVWLDGTKIDNSYLNLPFSGTLKASATQVE